MIRLYSTILVLFTVLSLSAQDAPSPIFVGSDAPAWMKMMLEPAPNVQQVATAYDVYYQTHPFEKNDYTQYYKRWMHWARSYMLPDGNLEIPDLAQLQVRENTIRKIRNNKSSNTDNPPPANWTFVGPKQTYDTDGVTELTWQTNIYSLDIAASNPNIIYAGGETGGLWRTDNKGLTWTLLTKELIHGSITAVEVDPTNADVVYMGTSSKIYKTINGGTSWTEVYAESGLDTYDIAIKADNPDVVLLAGNKGVLRTVSGGVSWSKLFTNVTWTLKSKPGTPGTFFGIRENGTSSNFIISTDGGATFSATGTGWWTPGTGEDVTGAHVAVCPSSPSKLYAYLCGSGSNLYGYIGVFVSTNNGSTWTNTNPANAIGNSPVPYVKPTHTNLMTSNATTGLQQGFYDMAIIVNPANSNELIAGGTSWYKSTDGGATWDGLGGYQSGAGTLSWSHPDIQALAANGSDLWIASDGGLNYSTNFGGSIVARMNGISGADLWGFDAGWNEDVLVGGRYHNGNMAWHELFPAGKFYRMGGGEAPTGYVNPGNARKMYFSDIGGKLLTGGFGGGVNNFPVGLFPNESYAYYANSEMAWDPRCFNTVFLGNENKIWKSTDGGTSWNALYTFPGTATNVVYDIEIARANPDVIYCSQWDGTDDAMWRSADGGATWTQLTALPLPNNNDRVKMAVSAENENVLWVAVTYGSNGKKIYKTIDGGLSWTNLTTSLLNGIRVTTLMAQYGTDGGIYLGTDAGVFYRNNTMSEWAVFSDGLPYSVEANKMKPFYKTGKIRNGCWGFGVWESDLFEPSAVIPQAITSALEPACSRDTVYFDDYSVVNHTGATWSWEFSPAPLYVSNLNARNPKVVFGTAGAYTATMTLNGAYTSTLDIMVDNRCAADTIPGKSVRVGGNSAPGYVSVPPLNLNTNTITISAWVKLEGVQPDYSCVFMHDDESAGFNFRGGDNHLGYHWGAPGAWWWDSGLVVPTDTWSHVAMVVEPTGVTLYLNGKASKHSFTVPMIDFTSAARLGNYKGWGDRYMKGQIDEVCIFNTSLSQSDIRELMHLTKDPAEFSNLVAYYQFNELSGPALDKVGVRHASLVSNAVRQISTAPVGKGHSNRITVNGNGVYTFVNTGLTLDFPSSGPYPAGELCVSRIDQMPDQVPGTPAGTGYWIVNNYGTNTNFAMLDEFSVTNFGYIETGSDPNDFNLFKRGSFADGSTWGGGIDRAEAVTPGVNGDVFFTTNNSITSFSQFIITYSGPLPLEWLNFQAVLNTRKEADLLWRVNQLDKVARFEVEKSADGVSFQKWKDVTAEPGSGIKNYSTTDQQPFAGETYYRIKQFDTDGKWSVSAVRSVRLNGAQEDWIVYPNPVTNGQSLTIQAMNEANFRFVLYDATGRKLKDIACEGNTVVSLPAQLPTGIYHYAIIGNTRRVSGNLVVGSK